MKKILLYFLGFVFVVFLLPVIFTTSMEGQEVVANETSSDNKNNSTSSNDENNLDKQNEASSNNGESNNNQNTNDVEQIQNFDENYLKYQTIRLLHTETGEIEELPMDEYLYGVVAAEMPASYEVEALKAQAIVARTYTIYQAMNSVGKHPNADICDNYGCCQAWISKEERFASWKPEEAEANWQKIVDCVNATTGKIITYNGQPINAFFHSNSGGITETSINIWGGIDYPYLKSVETSGENGYTQYSSEVILSKEDLEKKMKEKYSDFEINFSDSNCIQILEYTSSKRVKTIKIGNKEIAGTEARTILGLKSTNFTFTFDGNQFKFNVIGNGHGVGMSQTGADSMAKSGSNYEEIIKHFYTDVEIK